MTHAKWLILLLSILLGGCVTSNNSDNDVGEWTPMTDDNEDRDFSKEYGMPRMNGIFDGLALWEESPIHMMPPYSFHWYGNNIRLWVPRQIERFKYELDKYELKVDKCNGLVKALNTLKEKIKKSASKMIDDGPGMYRTTVVMSPTFYRVKVFPPNMMGSLTLTGVEWDGVSWIKEAQNVKEISNQCAKS